MPLTLELRSSLILAAQAATAARDPWWIIGSAAVALHGADVRDVHDIDLLMSADDAESLLRRVASAPKPRPPSAKFRSSVFGVWESPSLPVEVMGGFSVATDEGWVPVWPVTREEVLVDGQRLFIPSSPELVRLLHSFGRAKDFERARLLDAARR